MKFSEYAKLASRTSVTATKEGKERCLARITPELIALLHAGIGMATEAAEFLDMLKKHIYYGKPLDRVNLGEEAGDNVWYCAEATRELGISEDFLDVNIEKLIERFPDKFSEQDANSRDLEAEREVLNRLEG